MNLKLEKDAKWVAIPEGINGLHVNLYTVEDGINTHWESGSIVLAGKTVKEIYGLSEISGWKIYEIRH